MIGTSTVLVLSLGFVLGLKHATDPDHIVAVTTFLGEEPRLRRAWRVGLFWGLGHAAALSIVGLLVLGLKMPISRPLEQLLELVVAGMLVVLGARLIAAVHFGEHGRHHHDTGSHRFGLRPLFVGLVHGTAGSAALTLLVLSTITSTLNGLLYILIFGIGSMLGMLALSSVVAFSLSLARARLASAIRPIQISAGVLSCTFGIYLASISFVRLLL
jgi:hypothetical protein